MITDQLRKGRKLVFKNHSETILKGSTKRLYGQIKTNRNVYSVDFICRMIEAGFVTVEKDEKTFIPNYSPAKDYRATGVYPTGGDRNGSKGS